MIKEYLKSKRTFTPMAQIYEDELAELKLIIPVEVTKTGRINVASANEPEIMMNTYKVTMDVKYKEKFLEVIDCIRKR